MPFDDQGNLVDQSPSTPTEELGTIAPPGYGEHVLDQLYEDVDMSGFMTPGGVLTPGVQSGLNSPFYAQSQSGSSENLAGSLTHSRPVAPAALVSRLEDMSLDPSDRTGSYQSVTSVSYQSVTSVSGFMSPSAGHGTAPRSEPHSTSLTRSNSAEDGGSSRNSSEHADLDPAEFMELNKVPSYQTAVRTPARSRAPSGVVPLPDYQTALSAPRTPPANDAVIDPLMTISEEHPEDYGAHHVSRPTSLFRRSYTDEGAIHRRLHHMVHATGSGSDF